MAAEQDSSMEKIRRDNRVQLIAVGKGAYIRLGLNPLRYLRSSLGVRMGFKRGKEINLEALVSCADVKEKGG